MSYKTVIILTVMALVLTIGADIAKGEFKTIANDGLAFDDFGHAVSIDGPYAIVGAWSDDDNGMSRSGSAYIFERDVNGDWIQSQFKLTAANPAEEDLFGISVSISGTYAIVGAPCHDHDGWLDTGTTYIFERDGNGDWNLQATLIASDPSHYDHFGHSVSISGNYAIVGSSDSAYIFERDGNGDWIQRLPVLIAGDGVVDDYFGYSVSISGDYAIIGAPWNDDGGGSSSGSAYIFFRNNDGDWIEQDKITAHDASGFDTFGKSVSINGAYAIVGSPGDDDGGLSSGSAYIFYRDDEEWMEIDKLNATDGMQGDDFGYSVSINGDNAIVGAGGNDDDGASSGSAYLFVRHGVNWNHSPRITASDANKGDSFGEGVFISDDFVIIGAPSNANAGLKTGSAYIYNIDNVKQDCGRYAEDQIFAEYPSLFDIFGNAVSIDGDYAIVGAAGDSHAGAHSGAAYIFERDVYGIWNQKAKLTAGNDAAEGDRFGFSVSISGDFAIVGAWGDDFIGNNSGLAYIFKRDIGGNWLQPGFRLQGTAEDRFGYSVSIDGGYAIVGAEYGDDDDNGVMNTGAAYIFYKAYDAVVWDFRDKINAHDGAEGDCFGHSVSIDGDYAIVGASRSRDDGQQTGSAYIFKNHGMTWDQLLPKITASDAAGGDQFGHSVSISGNYAIVGAYGTDDGGDNSGSAYIFVRDDNDDWNQQPILTAGDDADVGDFFGSSVSINGDYAIVGASRNSDHGDKSGSAYIFVRDIGEWTELHKLLAGDAKPMDHFGGSVSISGDYVIVGAPWQSEYKAINGSAYIYHLTCELIPPGPHFKCLEKTGSTHIILIEETSFDKSFEYGSGDEIGVFTPDGLCVGSSLFHEGQIGITTWADDELTEEIDGFREGEAISFKYWDLDQRTEFPIGFELLGESATFTNDGISAVALNVFDYQEIELDQGWNMISANYTPVNPDMQQVLLPVMDQTIIAKDGFGRFSWIPRGFWGLDAWVDGNGYQIKVDELAVLLVFGTSIDPERPIPLGARWSLVAYYPDTELDAITAFANVVDDLNMAKNGDGQFYLPEFGFNNMRHLAPGEGFKVHMSDDVNLIWNTEGDGDGNDSNDVSPEPIPTDLVHFSPVQRTSDNMSILITEVPVTGKGVELACFSKTGLCIGAVALMGEGPYGMAVWEDDPTTEDIDGLTTGETFNFNLWDAERKIETPLHVGKIHKGSGLVYETDGLLILDLTTTPVIPDEYYLAQAYPNPFNSTTRIDFGIPETGDMSIRLYDITGRLVEELVNSTVIAGNHTLVWDASTAPAGIYMVQMSTESGFKSIRKIMLVK